VYSSPSKLKNLPYIVLECKYSTVTQNVAVLIIVFDLEHAVPISSSLKRHQNLIQNPLSFRDVTPGDTAFNPSPPVQGRELITGRSSSIKTGL
jgi:hypothetical protein